MGTRFFMNVTVPANTTSTIYVPSLPKTEVFEGCKAAEKSSGLKFIEFRDGYAIFEAGSGDYSFESKYQK